MHRPVQEGRCVRAVRPSTSHVPARGTSQANETARPKRGCCKRSIVHPIVPAVTLRDNRCLKGFDPS